MTIKINNMPTKPLILLGGGGHCNQDIDANLTYCLT